jgi:hypothetical protein
VAEETFIDFLDVDVTVRHRLNCASLRRCQIGAPATQSLRSSPAPRLNCDPAIRRRAPRSERRLSRSAPKPRLATNG